MLATPHQKSDRPRGFTLLELIIVMGLIAFLATLSVMAVSTFVTSSREAATRTTLLKIDRLLQTRREALDRFIEIADKRSGFFQPPEYIVYNSPDWQLFRGEGPFAGSPDPNYAVFLARKRFIRANFPQRFDDWDFDFPLDGADPPFTNAASNSNHDPRTESAEMLYHFLNNGALFGAPPVGEGDFLASEVADTDNDGLPEYIDAWGNPIRFYLWPTRLIRPIPSSGSPSDAQTQVAPPSSVFVDPEMYPNQNEHNYILYLMNTLPRQIVLGVDQDDILGINANPTPSEPYKQDATAFESQFHTMNTWLRPLVISAGEDGRLGLYEPNDTANKGHLAQPQWFPGDNPNWHDDLQDNLCNWYLRAGGR